MGFVLLRHQRPGSPCHHGTLARSRAPGRQWGRASSGHRALPWDRQGHGPAVGPIGGAYGSIRAVGSWSPILLWLHWAELEAPGLTWSPGPGWIGTPRGRRARQRYWCPQGPGMHLISDSAAKIPFSGIGYFQLALYFMEEN